MAVLAGIDFFTAEVITWRGLTTYYVVTATDSGRHHPASERTVVEQTARNLTDADSAAVVDQRDLLHDRDTKFCAGSRSTLRAGGVEPLRLRWSSPHVNAFADGGYAL
jgi:hypothetical protein